MLRFYGAIWGVSRGRQIALILMSVAIAALATAPLEIQKRIVNLLGESGAGPAELYPLGTAMLGFILLSLTIKAVMSFSSNVLGEDLIRLMRNRLVEMAEGRRAIGEDIGRGRLLTAVSAEAEDLGRFAGGAFSEPVVQIGTLVAVIFYIAVNQPGLGLVVSMMVLPQIAIVLWSQRRVNDLVAERVRLLRDATDQLTRDDIEAASRAVTAGFDEIYTARRRIFLWKSSAKLLITGINGSATVLVLMIGGLAVFQGRTDLGTVVAALTGLGRIQAPTAFLISFYRQVSSNRVKFDLLVSLVRPTPTAG